MKPNVVLFDENVRNPERIGHLLYTCDLLLVGGTSVQDYPATGVPDQVKHLGGLIYEFNMKKLL